jgi:hypothetical protein
MYVVPWQLLVWWCTIPPSCHGYCCRSKAAAISGCNPAHAAAFSPANAPSLLLLLLLSQTICKAAAPPTHVHCLLRSTAAVVLHRSWPGWVLPPATIRRSQGPYKQSNNQTTNGHRVTAGHYMSLRRHPAVERGCSAASNLPCCNGAINI